MIRFKCSNCQSGLKAPAEYEGKKVKCSKCSEIIRIPRMETPPDEQLQKDIFCICGHCKENFRVKYTSEEKKIKCPTCGSGLTVPGVQSRFSEKTTRFICGGCSMHYCVPSRYAAKKFPCLDCRHPVTVPVKPIKKSPPPAPAPQQEMQFDIDSRIAPQQEMDFGNDPGMPVIDELFDAPAPNWADQLDQEMALNAERRQKEKEQEDQKIQEAMSSGIPGQVTLSDGRVIKTGASKKQKVPSDGKSQLVVLAVIIGIYIAAGAGFFLFAGGEPPDGSQGAINASRSMIFKFCKGDFSEVTNLYDVIDVVENGIPEQPSDIIGYFPYEKPTSIMPELLYSNVDHHASGYLIRNVVKYEEDDFSYTHIIDMAMSEYDGVYNYMQVVVRDEEGNVSTFDDEEKIEIPQAEMQNIIDDYVFENASVSNSMALYALAVLIIIGGMNLISVFKVLGEAGEPGYAIFIPVYNMIALARAGDRPAYIGLLCGIVPIVNLFLFVYISIGIAQAYGRSVLFGIGMGVLPFIFYPALAFSEGSVSAN